MKLEDKIAQKVEELLQNPTLFLVGVAFSSAKAGGKLSVLIDGDEGLGIDDCVRISRALGHWIEEHNLIDSAYHLEVSSPGIDRALESLRQYRKNIGRKVKIAHSSGKTRKGQLLEANEEGILIEESVKEAGQKKAVLMQNFVPFAEIKKCNVLVSFD